MNCIKGLLGALMIGLVGMVARCPQPPRTTSAQMAMMAMPALTGRSQENHPGGVNAAVNGDTVLVTNGEYVLSGRLP